MFFPHKMRLCVAAALVFVAYQRINSLPAQTVVQSTTAAENSSVTMASSPASTKTLLGAVPDGSTVPYADFKKQVGPLADLLGFASPQSITRKGNHFILDNAGPATMTEPQAEVTLQKRVEFDVDPNSTDVSIKNVRGVTVKLSVITMDLKEAKLVVDANGDTTVSGKLSASSWLPNVPFALTFGPDGKLK